MGGQRYGGASSWAEADRAAGVLLGVAAGEALGSAEPGRWGGLTAAAATGAAHGAAQDPCLPLVRAAAVAASHLAYGPDQPAADLVTTAAGFAPDAEAGVACVLWFAAVRHAVRAGRLDVRAGLAGLPDELASAWEARLAEAEARPAADFCGRDAGPVQVLQAAWSALHGTPIPDELPRVGSFRVQHLKGAVEAAAAAGGGSVAAVAGSLAGATYGASAVPSAWRRGLRGPDSARAHDLVPAPEEGDYSLAGDLSALGPHPHDPRVWIGGYRSLRNLPAGVDAVVSLCPVLPGDVPAGVEHVEVRLADSPDPRTNPNLAFVLADTADLLGALCADGRTVLLHGVRGMSRVPAAACAYSFRRYAVPAAAALSDMGRVLLGARVNDAFRAALDSLAPVTEKPPVQRPAGGRVGGRSGRGFRGPGDWPEGRTIRRGR